LFDDSAGIWKLLVLDMLRVNRWCINGADAFDRGIEVVEGVFLDQGGDLGGNTAERLRFVDKNGTIGLFNGFDDSVLVQWADGAKVEDLGVDSVLGLENFGSFEAAEDAGAVSNEGDTVSFTFDVGFAEGDDRLRQDQELDQHFRREWCFP